MLLPVSNNGREFPRDLNALERDLINRQLPGSSEIYRRYRERIAGMDVVGLGKRGPGHLVLGRQNPQQDILELVTPVFALGGAEDGATSVTVVIHEVADETVSVELMTLTGNFDELDLRRARTWSISDWNPGECCPKCLAPVKEIRLPAANANGPATLAVCRGHRGIWARDGDLNMNHIIPVTGYLSELERQRNLRGAKGEHRSAGQVFDDLESYSDAELVRAFVLYNKFWRKMDIGEIEFEEGASSSFASRLFSRFVRVKKGRQ